MPDNGTELLHNCAIMSIMRCINANVFVRVLVPFCQVEAVLSGCDGCCRGQGADAWVQGQGGAGGDTQTETATVKHLPECSPEPYFGIH